MYDRSCPDGHTMIDCWEPVDTKDVPCKDCGKPTERTWLSKPSSVVGDECDIWIRHGLCNEDGSPRRYTSKSDIIAEAKRRGLVNWVEHTTEPGTDKSKHTTRWV